VCSSDLRRLEHEVLAAASSEREQLGSDIHEGIAQDLAGIALLLRGITSGGEDDPAVMEFAVAHINHAIGRARALARGLSPVQIAGGSVAAALSRFAADLADAHEIDVACCCDLGGLSLNAIQSDHLFRIAQESLRIEARQPGLRRVSVDLRVTPDSLILTTSSDGESAEPRSAEDERSWATLAYLVRVIGGASRIEAGSGGCTVIAIPLAQLRAYATAA
jgi:signal transduction histidine kinase